MRPPYPKKQIEDVYWPTYIYDVYSEMQLNGNVNITFKEALAEAIRRRNTGIYYSFLKERQEWNIYVQSIHEDMRKTFGMHVGIAEAVAEACKEKDLLSK